MAAFAALTRSTLSMIGAVLTTVSAVLFLALVGKVDLPVNMLAQPRRLALA